MMKLVGGIQSRTIIKTQIKNNNDCQGSKGECQKFNFIELMKRITEMGNLFFRSLKLLNVKTIYHMICMTKYMFSAIYHKAKEQNIA